MDHPVTARFKLIETLDAWVLGILVVYCVIWAGLELYRFWMCPLPPMQPGELKRHFDKIAIGRFRYVIYANRAVGYLLSLGTVGYLVWRFFFAWKGIYYP